MLTRTILPYFASLGGRILWIGCQRYTKEYPGYLSRNGGECWTIDLDPKVAKWGSLGHHLIWDIRLIDELLAVNSFDIVLCNGVLGFGVNELADQKQTMKAVARIMKPGGWFLIGWNSDRTPDPISNEMITRHFERAAPPGIEGHISVLGSTHVYDFLRRKNSTIDV